MVFKHLSNLEPETSTVSFHTLSCECEEPWQQIHSPQNLTEGVGVARVGPGRGFCLQFQFEESRGRAEPSRSKRFWATRVVAHVSSGSAHSTTTGKNHQATETLGCGHTTPTLGLIPTQTETSKEHPASVVGRDLQKFREGGNALEKASFLRIPISETPSY